MRSRHAHQRTELSAGREQVDVVAAHEVLRHTDDGLSERCLSMVVGGVLGYVPWNKRGKMS